MNKTVALIGALDTKWTEYAFVKQRLEARGLKTLLIDVGVLGAPGLKADVSREEVARLGGAELSTLQKKQDRGEALAVMSRGAASLLPKLFAEGRVQGVMALGGTGGTSVACAAMRALPLGVPKVMVSTVAGSDVSGYVGTKDIVMIPSIVDVSGVNRISREVFARAAGALCGMVETEIPRGNDRPLIVASMFWNTTPAVERAKALLEQEEYEVLVFHCTGTGGRTLEDLVESGLIAGVLDITTTELADELVGGVFSAGPTRLTAAAIKGVPAVVVPGCLDMVNFWAPETVPVQFKGRTFYPHNPNVTLMRTNVQENQAIGMRIGERLSKSKAPVTVLLPGRGLSMIDSPGEAFWCPEADQALFQAIRQHLRPDIPVIEMDLNINDEEFAGRCARCLLENMAQHEAAGRTAGA